MHFLTGFHNEAEVMVKEPSAAGSGTNHWLCRLNHSLGGQKKRDNSDYSVKWYIME